LVTECFKEEGLPHARLSQEDPECSPASFSKAKVFLSERKFGFTTDKKLTHRGGRHLACSDGTKGK
jgi:hypothetical protein